MKTFYMTLTIERWAHIQAKDLDEAKFHMRKRFADLIRSNGAGVESLAGFEVPPSTDIEVLEK